MNRNKIIICKPNLIIGDFNILISAKKPIKKIRIKKNNKLTSMILNFVIIKKIKANPPDNGMASFLVRIWWDKPEKLFKLFIFFAKKLIKKIPKHIKKKLII